MVLLFCKGKVHIKVRKRLQVEEICLIRWFSRRGDCDCMSVLFGKGDGGSG